jgi:hypothetical protein
MDNDKPIFLNKLRGGCWKKILKKLRKKIPQDLALVGFGDS